MIRPGDSPYWPPTEHCGGHWRSDNNGAEAEAFCEAGPIPNQQGSSFLYTRQSRRSASSMVGNAKQGDHQAVCQCLADKQGPV